MQNISKQIQYIWKLLNHTTLKKQTDGKKISKWSRADIIKRSKVFLLLLGIVLRSKYPAPMQYFRHLFQCFEEFMYIAAYFTRRTWTAVSPDTRGVMMFAMLICLLITARCCAPFRQQLKAEGLSLKEKNHARLVQCAQSVQHNGVHRICLSATCARNI